VTWEETIQYIRTKPEYKKLVRESYLEEDLEVNVKRFSNSKEFSETLNIIRHYAQYAKRIADIGAGNGVSSVALAQRGYEVVAVEPYESSTVGYGAIKILKQQLNLSNLTVLTDFGESISLPDASVDVVYVRQAMHHAADLRKFIAEAARILKSGGLFIGVREHIVYDEKDRQWFLESHPLQKFYGGENAYTVEEYSDAITRAGLKLEKVIPYFENVINYFPLTQDDFNGQKLLENKIGGLSKLKSLQALYAVYFRLRYGKNILDDSRIAGRMYSFIALKP
jgi:ubiquinone/menaquinone biosynthesis C-methylase UbiE